MLFVESRMSRLLFKRHITGPVVVSLSLDKGFFGLLPPHMMLLEYGSSYLPASFQAYRTCLNKLKADRLLKM